MRSAGLVAGVGDVLDKLNPFSIAGDAATKVIAEGWTGLMLTIWGSGLWVLRFVLTLMDAYLTPDLSADGPAALVYAYTFWAAGSLLTMVVLAQIAVAVFRRDGQSLARVALGLVQFVGVWAAWIAYAVMLVAACGGLTLALMRTLLEVDAWADWEPTGTNAELSGSGMEAIVATVLGGLGLFMWMAAIGHFFIMLTRAGALLVLSVVMPLSAAGLVAEGSRAWFWKSLRWFHAAALTPVLTVLVMGIGTQLTSAVAQGAAKNAEAAVGTALPSTMLILMSVASPLALFRLLAFVDPGTSSGASMRAGMNASGGLQGVLGGGSSQSSSGAAATAGSDGSSGGEAQRNSATEARFGSVLSGLGSVGGAYAAGAGVVMGVGTQAAALGADEMNQSAVGDSSYVPDAQRATQRGNPDQRGGSDRERGSSVAPTAGHPPGAGPSVGPTSGSGANAVAGASPPPVA